jgi:tetratricopeptide (TPR) repeat protein
MYDRTGFLSAIRTIQSSNRLLCAGFQRDLSSLLDHELPEESARRSLAHMEACSDCSEFFQAIRLQALAHRDLALPGSLAKRMRRMRGDDLFEGLTDSEIIRRMASALYQLGKAYVLMATDNDYLLRVAEEPVIIDRYASEEASDAVEAASQTGACHVSKEILEARSKDGLSHGLKLLEEALRLKPKFAEALLYKGFVSQVQGEYEIASEAYHQVFLRSDRLTNRAHAAIQLGMLYDRAHDYVRALRMYRWVVSTGLVNRKPEFAFVLFNIAVEHVSLGDLDSAAGMLRRIRLQHSTVWESTKKWLRGSSELLSRLKNHGPCREEFEASEPAFFAA